MESYCDSRLHCLKVDFSTLKFTIKYYIQNADRYVTKCVETELRIFLYIKDLYRGTEHFCMANYTAKTLFEYDIEFFAHSLAQTIKVLAERHTRGYKDMSYIQLSRLNKLIEELPALKAEVSMELL